MMAIKNSQKNLSKNKKKNIFFSSKVLLFLIIFFAFLILLILFFQLNLFNKIFPGNQSISFIIEDNCGVILGNLMHEVKNEDDCNIRCNNECVLRKLKQDFVNFSYGEESCNSCECFCN